MAEENIKLSCSVEFDDEWFQKDCHWLYNRFFNLTWTAYCVGVDLDEYWLYYRLGPKSANDSDYIKIEKNQVIEKSTGSKKCWTYQLDFSSFSNEDLHALHDSGCITVYIKATDIVNKTDRYYSAYATLQYDLELPPKDIPEVSLNRVSADHIICSWTKAETVFSDTDSASVAGYVVELFHRPVGSDTYKRISGLGKQQDANGKWKLIKLPDTQEDIKVPDVLEGEEEIISFIGSGTTSEIYLDGADTTEVYFRPRDFGIEKKDYFKFVVFPYIVYSCFLDTEEQTNKPGAFLGPQDGTESKEMEFKLGVVRVKTESGWVEGQVWVYTEKGWVEADGVYAKTTDGWQESI